MSDNKDKVNEESIKKFEKDYSEESFFDKILKYAKVIGVNLIYKALQLYYVLQKPDVPVADKGIIIAALGYLISPLDFIPVYFVNLKSQKKASKIPFFSTGFSLC